MRNEGRRDQAAQPASWLESALKVVDGTMRAQGVGLEAFEEIRQNTVVFLLEGDEPLAEKRDANAYVAVVTRFRALEFFRQNGRLPQTGVPEDLMPSLRADFAVDSRASTDVRLDVWQAIEQLPLREQVVIVLCGIEGFYQEEAARVMGCKRSAVQRLLGNAKRRLRRMLKAAYGPTAERRVGSSA